MGQLCAGGIVKLGVNGEKAGVMGESCGLPRQNDGGPSPGAFELGDASGAIQLVAPCET